MDAGLDQDGVPGQGQRPLCTGHAGGIDLGDPAGRVQFVVEAGDDADPGQGRVSGGGDGRGQVAWPIGGQVVEVAHRAGEDDRAAERGRSGEQVGEERGVLQGVRAMGDHHAVEAVVEDGRAGPAGLCQHRRR